MTNSVGSGILGFRLRGVPYPDFPQRLASSLILADDYSKLRVCPAEMPRCGRILPAGPLDGPAHRFRPQGLRGTALRALTAEVARSPDHDLFDLLPTHRSSIGYRRGRTNYMIHPDASFTLEYKGKWLPLLLEFERRATTPKRIPRRLASYRRYFASGCAERDHGGRTARGAVRVRDPGEREHLPGRGRRHGGPGRDRRQRGGPGGARYPGRGVDTAAAALPGPEAAGRIVLSSQSTTFLRRTFPVGGLQQP